MMDDIAMPTATESTVRDAWACTECEELVSQCDDCSDYFSAPPSVLMCAYGGTRHYHESCWQELLEKYRKAKEANEG